MMTDIDCPARVGRWTELQDLILSVHGNYGVEHGQLMICIPLILEPWKALSPLPPQFREAAWRPDSASTA